MLDIRTDRLTNRLLCLAVLLGVVRSTVHAETTPLARRFAPGDRGWSTAQPGRNAVRGPAGLGAEASLQPARVDCRGGVES